MWRAPAPSPPKIPPTAHQTNGLQVSICHQATPHQVHQQRHQLQQQKQQQQQQQKQRQDQPHITYQQHTQSYSPINPTYSPLIPMFPQSLPKILNDPIYPVSHIPVLSKKHSSYPLTSPSVYKSNERPY